MLKELEMLGLSPKEAEIYLELSKEGASEANKLSRLTNSNRTVVYNTLQNLIKKGLISFSIKNSKRIYQISDFNNILTNLQEKERLAKELVTKLKEIKSKKTTPSITEIYEGKEGLSLVNREMLSFNEIRILNATGLIKEELKYSDALLKKFLRKEIKIIANKNFVLPFQTKSKKLKIKYLNQKPINYATTFILKDIVIIQVLKKDCPLLLKVKNKALYEGYKENFDELWKALK